jgi:hypothetical protein
MCAPQLKPKLNGDFLLESKEQMKTRRVRSPDLADSVALTFASNEWFKDYSEPAPGEQFGQIDKPTPAPNFDLGAMGISTGWMA